MKQRVLDSARRSDVPGSPRRELAKRLFGARARFWCVDDELLVRFGVGGECVPFERDLADDRMVVRAGAAPLDGDVGAGPPLAELGVSDREVADEFGEARVVWLARCLHAYVRHNRACELF